MNCPFVRTHTARTLPRHSTPLSFNLLPVFGAIPRLPASPFLRPTACVRGASGNSRLAPLAVCPHNLQSLTIRGIRHAK